MKNIPRLDELAQIREEFWVEMEQEKPRTEEELGESEIQPGAIPVGELGMVAGVPAAVAAEGERKDRMITVPGSKKSPKAGKPAPLFEGLNMSIGKVRGGTETQGREGGAPTEITRKTVVKVGQAPKDTVFGLKDIGIGRDQGKVAESTSGVGVPRAGRPRDGTLGAGEVKFSPQGKAKDALFTSKDLQVKGKGTRPSDTTLLTPGKGRVSAGGQPKELEPGKRRIEVIDPSAGESEAGKPGKRPKGRGKGSDDEIGWIH